MQTSNLNLGAGHLTQCRKLVTQLGQDLEAGMRSDRRLWHAAGSKACVTLVPTQ